MRIIAGTHKNQLIVTLKGLNNTRPTSGKLRESLFNICQGYIADARFLDLFAGSGAMGFEALSRGAGSATFIDNSRDALRCIKKNIEQMEFGDKAIIMSGDVFALLERLNKLGRTFDVIYADPPYGGGLGIQVLKMIDESNLLVPNGDLFIEDEATDSQDDELQLKTLELVSSRKMGRALLRQYRKIQ